MNQPKIMAYGRLVDPDYKPKRKRKLTRTKKAKRLLTRILLFIRIDQWTDLNPPNWYNK